MTEPPPEPEEPDEPDEGDAEDDQGPMGGPRPPPAALPGLTPSTAGKSAAQLMEEAKKAVTSVGEVGRAKVDKYFGTKLPPVCRQLGCYVTDDGKFFYCINPHCHKDRKRETKYNRRRKSVVYFFCPKCKSREIQLHLRANNYECLDCAYVWRK